MVSDNYRSFSYKLFIIIALLLLSGCGANTKIKAERPRGPINCLLITIDTLRADHVGCYGNKGVQTPAIDRSAKEGVLFSQAFTPVPITLPSHTSIMTGMYPSVHGVKDNGIFILDDSFTTLAEVLSSKGYKCAAFLGSFILDARFGLSQGFDVYEDQMAPPGSKSPSLYQEKDAEKVTKGVLDFLNNEFSRPFFIWAHYFDPHIPYAPPHPFMETYKDSPYDGEIAYTDSSIAKILNLLERKGELDNTLIVLTADHGEGLGEHNEKTHGVFIYDTTLHVPLVMRCPLILPKGRRIEHQVRTIDLFPTIIDLLGFEIEETQCNGESLLPYLLGNKQKGLVLHCSSDYPNLGFGWAPLEGIRAQGWKYILAPKPELYNLARDTKEMENLVNVSPDKADSLKARLTELKQEASLKARELTPLAIDTVTQERLLSLGYVSFGTQGRNTDSENIFNLPDPKDKIAIVNDLDLGMSEFSNGNFDSAADIFKTILLSDPENLLANFMLGSACQMRGQFKEALSAFNRVLQKNPDYLDIHQHLGQIYLNMGETDRAIQEFTLATRTDLGRAEALNSLGQIYCNNSEFKKAIEAFKDALLIDPNSPEIHYNLGTTLELNGEHESAIKEYTRAIDLSPEYVEAWNNLGHLYEIMGRLDKSVSCLKKAIDLDPNQASFYNNLGLAYQKMGRTKESIEQFKKAERLNPKMIAPKYNLAVIKSRQKDYPQAEEEFLEIIGIDPFFIEAYYNLGSMYMEDGKIDMAINILKEAIRIRPDHLKTRIMLDKLVRFKEYDYKT